MEASYELDLRPADFLHRLDDFFCDMGIIDSEENYQRLKGIVEPKPSEAPASLVLPSPTPALKIGPPRHLAPTVVDRPTRSHTVKSPPPRITALSATHGTKRKQDDINEPVSTSDEDVVEAPFAKRLRRPALKTPAIVCTTDVDPVSVENKGARGPGKILGTNDPPCERCVRKEQSCERFKEEEGAVCATCYRGKHKCSLYQRVKVDGKGKETNKVADRPPAISTGKPRPSGSLSGSNKNRRAVPASHISFMSGFALNHHQTYEGPSALGIEADTLQKIDQCQNEIHDVRQSLVDVQQEVRELNTQFSTLRTWFSDRIITMLESNKQIYRDIYQHESKLSTDVKAARDEQLALNQRLEDLDVKALVVPAS